MKPLQFIITIVVIVLAWASLFITILNQSSKTNQLLRNDNTLLGQQKLTLDSIQSNARTRTAQLNDLQAHIDCLFNLATQPNHNAYIANASACTISSTTGTAGAGAPASSPQPSKVFVSSPPSQSAPSSGNKQTNKSPSPAKSIICTLTLGLFKC